MVSEKKKHNEPQYPAEISLSKALTFDINDLSANRDGYISPRQRQRLRKSYIFYSIIAILAACVIVSMSLAIAFLLLMGRGNTSPVDILVPLIVVFGILIWLKVSFRNFISKNNSLKSDLHNGKVDFIISTIEHFKKRPVRRTESVEFYILAGELTFEVSSMGYAAFLEGVTYCLYYAPSSRTLLSAEPVTQHNIEFPNE